MPSSEKDDRKKRQVHPIEEETPKKVRVDDDAQKERSKSPEPAPISSNKMKVPPSPPSSSSSNVTSKSKSKPKTSPAVAAANDAKAKPAFHLEKIRSMWKDNKNRRVWDLEGALHYLVQELDEKEFLTHDETTWITFRVGHAGDASTIASWYRLAKQQLLLEEEEAKETEAANENIDDDLEEEDPEIEVGSMQPPQHIPPEPAPTEDRVEEGGGDVNASPSTSMLEVWLADGFGDDRRLPYVYSLVVDAHTIPRAVSSSNNGANNSAESSSSPSDPQVGADKKKGAKVVEIIDSPPGDLKKSAVNKELGAVALLTMGFDEGLKKILKIEWLGLNPDLSTEVLTMLRQRFWLRLSTLAVMTACQGGIEWEHRTSLDPLKQQEDQEKKKQEREDQELQEVAKEASKKPAARVSPRAE
ncbi:MAG: hypothetical protein SGBAC_011057 [Bacillariaceae sp.]